MWNFSPLETGNRGRKRLPVGRERLHNHAVCAGHRMHRAEVIGDGIAGVGGGFGEDGHGQQVIDAGCPCVAAQRLAGGVEVGENLPVVIAYMKPGSLSNWFVGRSEGSSCW